MLTSEMELGALYELLSSLPRKLVIVLGLCTFIA
jgi:hypothetical protein